MRNHEDEINRQNHEIEYLKEQIEKSQRIIEDLQSQIAGTRYVGSIPVYFTPSIGKDYLYS